MRDPKLGSVITDPAGPIAGGVSLYGSIRRSVRAEYSVGPEGETWLASGRGSGCVCAAHVKTPRHNAKSECRRCLITRMINRYGPFRSGRDPHSNELLATMPNMRHGGFGPPQRPDPVMSVTPSIGVRSVLVFLLRRREFQCRKIGTPADWSMQSEPKFGIEKTRIGGCEPSVPQTQPTLLDRRR